jgi:hypothetical protein
MGTTWKTIAVRIARPPDLAPADFLAVIRSWLNHHCILLADFKSRPKPTHLSQYLDQHPKHQHVVKRRPGAEFGHGWTTKKSSQPPSRRRPMPAAIR